MLIAVMYRLKYLYVIVARRSSTYMVHGTLHADRFVTEMKRGDFTPPIYGYSKLHVLFLSRTLVTFVATWLVN